MENRFGRKLKWLRNQKKMGLRELAKRCKIDCSNLCKTENGKARLPIKHFYNISKELGLTINEATSLLREFQRDLESDIHEKLNKIKYWGNI